MRFAPEQEESELQHQPREPAPASSLQLDDLDIRRNLIEELPDLESRTRMISNLARLRDRIRSIATLSAPPIARLGRTMNSFLRPAFSGVFLVAVIDWQLGQEGIAQDEMG
jgi:hypothetical protein